MNDTRSYFNHLAGQWDQMMPQKEATRYLEPLIKMNILSTDFLLDIGTGTGSILKHILSLHPADKVIAMDIAEQMLNRCACNNPSCGRLICADASSIPLRDGSVDAIVCFSAFPHFASQPEAVSEFYRILRLEGRILILHFQSSACLNEFHRSLSPPVCYDRLPSMQELSRMFADCDFKGLEFTENENLFLALFQK